MDYSELLNIASLLVRLLYVKKYSDPSVQHCKEAELFRREGQAGNETRPCVVKLLYFRGKGPCMVLSVLKSLPGSVSPLGLGEF